MGLGDALRLVRRRWRVMTAVVLACLLLGAALTARSPASYRATAQVFVSVVLPADAAGLAAANTFSTARVQSYVSLVTTPAVTDAVVAELALPTTGTALAGRITATAPANRLIVEVAVTDRSAQGAARIANAVAGRFIGAVEGLERTQNGGASPVRATLTRPAQPPGSPASPRLSLNLALALLAGLLLGFFAVRLRAAADDGVGDVDELEQLAGCPVLGVLPRDRRGARRVGAPGDGHSLPDRSLAGRAAHLAAANVELVGLPLPPGTVALTAAGAGAGTTYAAVHLAARLGSPAARVCLVDADLRAPGLAARLGLPSAAGLTRALLRGETADELVRELRPGLAVVLAGPPPPHPAQVLSGVQAGKIVAELAGSFRCTLLDSGPVLPHGDGARAAALAEVTVLVVRARHTSRSDLRQALSRLAEVDVRPVGVLLTRARPALARGYLRGHAPDQVAAPRTR